MSKTYYFLCGLPRAGNTLFASLLNQNPGISVTANSVVGDMIGGLSSLRKAESFQSFPDEASYGNVMENILPNFYRDWPADVIIDRSAWGTPDRLYFLENYLSNPIKIIVLVRDLKEILASFVRFSYTSENNFIAKQAKTLEERCDFVMMSGGQLNQWVEAVYNLTNTPRYRQYIHIVEYDDLVDRPEQMLDKVYNFLELPKYSHQFNQLAQLSNQGIQYDDAVYGGALHTIKTGNIEKSAYDPMDFLPKDVARRYRLDRFWRY